MGLKRKRKKQHGTITTMALVIILVLVLILIWAEFISGPNRVKEQIYTQRIEKIEKKNKDIQGISEHIFSYTTYQGYDDTTLYWYNAKSNLITTRDIDTLNYKKAKRIAKKSYKIKCDSIVLGYGYNNPVYEIRGSNKLILLDYDSFERVYEREIK